MNWTKLAFAAEIEAGQFEIGDHSYGVPILYFWHKKARLIVGKYCSIAGGVRILLGGNHHSDWLTTFPLPLAFGTTPAGVDLAGCERQSSDVVIGHDVWIGQEACIVSGVRIGDGAIIGAYSVVRSDVPPYSIVTGNPSREVRKRFDAETIDKLRNLCWWDWPDDRVAAASDILLSGDIDRLVALDGSCHKLPPQIDDKSDDRKTEHHSMYEGNTVNLPISLHDVRGSYLDLLVKCISNTIYGDANRGFWQSPEYNAEARRQGTDWPEVAHSMIGTLRLENLRLLTETVIREEIPGDLIETGVWRGGACILMRGVLKAYQDRGRKVFVADSFQGIPPPDEAQFPADAGQAFHLESFLAVSRETVAANFAAYGLLDDQVEFVPGWFKDTLHKLNSRSLALIRLDGDLYESTIQALDALYYRLSVGGFVIVDDYGSWPNCRQAVTDFRAKWAINDPIVQIDSTGVYWRKTSPTRG